MEPGVPELQPVFSLPNARDLILEAALALFAERGFHGATMREIAAHAKVSQSLLHHHFTNKEALWKQVGERISADFLQFMSETIETPEPGVAPALRRYLSYWKEHPAAFRFNLWRLLEGLPEERKQRSESLNASAVPVFARAQQAGLVRNDMPPGLAMIIGGGLIQFWLHSQLEIRDALAVTGHAAPDDETFLNYVVDLITPSDRHPQRAKAGARPLKAKKQVRKKAVPRRPRSKQLN